MATAKIQLAKVPLTKPVTKTTDNPPRTISPTQIVPASDIRPTPVSVQPVKQKEPSEFVIKEIMIQKRMTREQAIQRLKNPPATK